MKPPVERLEISMEELEDILERAKTSPLTEEECAKLHKAFETLMYVTDLVGDKDTTIARLRKILFGASTEKIRNVLGGEGPKAASWKRRERRVPLESSLSIQPGRRSTKSPRDMAATGLKPSPEPGGFVSNTGR